MAFPKHCLLAFGGRFGSTESWSCSLRMTSSSMTILGDDLLAGFAESAVEEVAEKVQQFMSDAGGFWNIDATLGFVKFNGIGADGKYVGNETSQVIHIPEIPAAQSSSNGPYQIAGVISLGTENARGLAAHGRFYVPTSIPVIDHTGHTNAAFQTNWGNAAKTFIDSLNNWQGNDPIGSPNVAVVSRGKKLAGGGYGPGKWANVTLVRVGNVLDTQRSRRRSLVEQYSDFPIDPGSNA